MSKIDFKKVLPTLYNPSAKTFSVVEVPQLNFLLIDGAGDPNRALAYQAALETLYAVAYTLKFMSKKQLDQDYGVPPLEGLWWADDMENFTTRRDKTTWQWTMMIMTPAWITEEMVAAARATAASKKALSALAQLRFAAYTEGLAVQILHIGSYDDEGPVLARLHQEWLGANGYVENGKHHEIYLSDARRVEPGKLKTILRQPIRKNGVTVNC